MPDLPVVGGDRSCVDQHAALTGRVWLVLAHCLRGNADHVEGAHQIDVDDLLEEVQRVRAVLADGPGGRRDARAVDQPEKRTELERGGHDCLCVGFLGDIAMHIALPKIRGERLAGLILDVGEHDASAGLRQHAGGTRAKARSAPGNDEYFICDFHGDPNG